MEGIDLALYDFDRHNALYYFAANNREDIYFRYGGRDSEAADTYLHLDSLQVALQQGLDQHQLFLAGKLPSTRKTIPRFPKDTPGLNEHVVRKNRCVECHHIAHFETTVAEKKGTLDKLHNMYRSPDIKTLGIHLDVPKGLVIKETKGAAQQSGLLPHDRIKALNSIPLLTYGDLQHTLNTIKRSTTAISLQVERVRESQTTVVEVQIKLPHLWWATDLSHRRWTVNPIIHFSDKALTTEEKSSLNLAHNSLASRVTEVDIEALIETTHELEIGDIITSINGKTSDALGLHSSYHIRIFHRAGDTLTLGVQRGDSVLQIPLHTKRQVFRRMED